MANSDNRRSTRRTMVGTSYEDASRYSSRYSSRPDGANASSSREGRSTRSASAPREGRSTRNASAPREGRSTRNATAPREGRGTRSASNARPTADGTRSRSSRASAADAYSRYSRDSYGTSSARPSRSAATRRSRNSVPTMNNGYVATNSYNGGGRSKLPFIIGAVVAVILIVAIAAFVYINSINSKLQSSVDDDLLSQLKATEYTGQPFYTLLLGVDRSDDREADEGFGSSDAAYRADSIILARIDPQQKKATLISFPRDTMVDMGEYGTQKLNAAYSLGGAAYMVECVSKIAGVDISHYAEVDFEGFCNVVDAVGGIEVDVPIAINDEEAGGWLEAGYQTLNGEDALILCRTRHTYDDVGAGDLYRAANQRMVLSAIAKKILNSDPATMVNAINVAAESVRTDLSVTDILSIATSMRGLDPSTDIYTCSVPTTSQYIDELWYEVINETKWSAMMKRVDQGLSPSEETVVDDTTGTILASSGDGSTASTYDENAKASTSGDGTTYSGTVAVRNGSNTAGAAQKAADIIAKLGFTTDVGNADSSDYQTTLVIYSNANQADAAEAILNAIGTGKVQKNDGSYNMTCDYLVVIGADYK